MEQKDASTAGTATVETVESFITASGTGRSSTFVGRRAELHLLTNALELAKGGTPQFHLLAGEPGMGKTRLAQELAAIARTSDVCAVWARCWEGGDAPAYWPWTHLLSGLLEELSPEVLLEPDDPATSYVAQMVPAVRKVVPVTAPTVRPSERTRFLMFEAIVQLLRRAGAHRPCLLLLDDLHAADEPSLQLLSFVTRSLDSGRVMVVGTYVDAEARSRRIGQVLATIGRHAHRVQVSGLDRAEVAVLYQCVTGHAAPEPVVAALHEATEGNPLFVDETIRLLEEEGAVRRGDHSLGFRVPQGAREVLRRRLAPLPDDVLWVLSIASVIGREFDVGTLQELCDVPVGPLLETLTAATDAGVVKEVGSLGRYCFTHVLMRETLYEELTPGDRMRLHDEIGTVLEHRHHDDLDEHLGQLAHHFFKAAQAGDRSKAVDYSVRAAERARAAMAYEEAARLYERALKVADLGGVTKGRRDQIRNALDEIRRSVKEVAVHPVSGGRRSVFRKQGDFWTIEYEGHQFQLRDSKGLRYLAHLLRNPDREVHALELVAAIEWGPRRPSAHEGEGLRPGSESAGEILDAEAKAAYRRRIEDLQDDVAEAERFNDPERAARAQAEIDALLEQLAASIGLGGRDRHAASNVERARISISKAVKKTVERVAAHDPALGRHLGATVKTGIFCEYRPDPRTPVWWEG
jgi:hypothetical protein